MTDTKEIPVLTPALGAGGRAFKSPRPDQTIQSLTSGIIRLNTRKSPSKCYPNCYPSFVYPIKSAEIQIMNTS